MTRYELLPDWPDRLAAVIRSSQDQPFEWGKHDCALWTSSCVEAMTGIDTLAGYRGKYKTPKGALRQLLRRDGVLSTLELADKHWGERRPIAFARLGDVVMADLGEPRELGPSLGICYGRTSLFVGIDAGHQGLIRLETLSLEHSYQPWASSSRA